MDAGDYASVPLDAYAELIEGEDEEKSALKSLLEEAVVNIKVRKLAY
jgi:hypothetical protein